jgi:hypothetical protein
VNDLTLICETCHFPVTGNSGSIYVRLGDVRDKRHADQEWKQAHPAGAAIDIHELLTMPGDIRWRVGHDSCRADRDEACYEIDDDKIATWPALARWTAHLMEKGWFPLSDWDDLLREVAGEIPSRRIRVAAREAA